MRPGCCRLVLLCEQRAQGRPGARCTRGLACKFAHKKTHTSIQVQRRQSGLPCAMVLRLMPCSPRRRIRSCHRHRRIKGFAEPGWARKTSADLASATDARTTRFCRTLQAVRLRAVRSLTGLSPTRPAITCAPDAAASTASRPNVRDDGQRPSAGRDGDGYGVIWVRRQEEYFPQRG
jgi:hypothetical protein